MTPERFSNIDRWFQHAIGEPPEHRAELLRRRCDDERVRAEVEALLAVDTNAALELDHVVSEAVGDLETSDIGMTLGPYRLVREIGRGGMATVFEAVRSDGEFALRVAVKLVRPGMDFDTILRRFRAERQILANLRHPHIAALLDGGSTPDGRPYLVMELIEGSTVTEYLARYNPPVRDRLRLFRDLCGGVQYAHEHRVIHRDIKAGNVLVTPEGVPKLLDFGIARLLSPEAQATEEHARPMTPEYASPEQRRGESLTEATDIYSMGVLLCEMLTGSRPSAAHKPHLKGDLATILATATREESQHRYASIRAFSDDVGRYLDGRPILARKDSRRYRAWKWMRRSPWMAAATLAAVLGLVLAGGSAMRLRRAADVRHAAVLCERAGHLLNDPRVTTEGSGDLMTSIALYQEATRVAPGYVAGWLGLAEAAEFAIDFDRREARGMLRLAERAAHETLRLEPRQAKAWELVGVIHSRRGKLREALAAYGRAVELNPRAPYAVRSYSSILLRAGREKEALGVLDRALAGLPDAANPDWQAVSHRGRAILLAHRGWLLNALGRPEEGLRDARRAIDIDRSYRLAYWTAGVILESLQQFEPAEQELRTAVRLAPRDARLLASLAHLLAGRGNSAEVRTAEAQLLAMHAGGRPVGCALALLHMGSKDTAAALSWLEQAVADMDFLACSSDPRFSRLRNHPRFVTLSTLAQNAHD